MLKLWSWRPPAANGFPKIRQSPISAPLFINSFMIRALLNWRSLLALVAIVIVSATIFYSQYLAREIAKDERQKVELWVDATKAILKHPDMDLTLPNLIRNGQQFIPIIETTEQDS